ncbi:tetratricopeptide repeat protein [Polaribacter ponticola]|uniref:Tetratricopeptide repeat protein n=1 Tax=Polaribacter ponticola TaxID=2978475 RepID=A0ABT5S9L0_9FLAO|nr:tetratricopeptide repeat protein [Polaribacter sp. MSW5]MDD7914802.1 tetratricopeptide repeat protein [Polaribacter sp. MSW5]
MKINILMHYLFIRSKASKEKNISQKASYWEAETLYRLKKHTESLSKFIKLNTALKTNNNFPLLEYNIAYTHFKLKQYEEATIAFNQFIKKENIEHEIKDDAIIRLGDSYFATRNYLEAIKHYKTVVKNSGAGADYAQFQIGMSFGFRNENDNKIDALTKVVNNYNISSLKDDALSQLAITYTKIKKNTKAHEAYDRLLKKHPKSSLLPRALVRQGLLYYNDNKNKKAIEKFKLVVKKFPNTPDALEAVANAKNIYLDEDNFEEYVAWVRQLKFVNVSESEADDSTFSIAEKKYFDGQNNFSTIFTLKKYLDKFPEGAHYLKANYYLADVLFKDEKFDEAIVNYKIVLQAGTTQYSEDVLAKLSQIYLEKQNFDEALPLLERLAQEAYVTENVLFAQSNLMKGYYETKSYIEATEYAKKVLSKNNSKNSLGLDAITIIARSSFNSEDYTTSEEYYTELEKNATGELKAETLYYSAFFKNQQKEYDASNKIVQNLIANYSVYKYWGVKSYVTMAKNYYSLKDAYQATFILENVIKNFSKYKDIVKEAQEELDKIKENEAKTNNSIIPQNKN